MKCGSGCREIRNCFTEDVMFCNDIQDVSNEERYIIKTLFRSMEHMSPGS